MRPLDHGRRPGYLLAMRAMALRAKEPEKLPWMMWLRKQRAQLVAIFAVDPVVRARADRSDAR
jgi:hypothetical protein